MRVNEDRSEQLSISAPRSLLERLRDYSDKHDRPISRVARKAIAAYLDAQEGKK